MESSIRVARPDDLSSVLALWQEAEAEPSHTDDLSSLRLLLEHDADALLVADGDGRLVGSVIAAWDGWRGSIYRLVVAPQARRQGLARELIRRAEMRLASLGAKRLQAIVVETDDRALGFWQASDWGRQAARSRFVKG